MFKKFLCSVAATAALALVAHCGEANAGLVEAFYSTDGGVTVTPLNPGAPSPTFSFNGSIGTAWDFNLITSLVQPADGLALMNANASDTHSGTGTDHLILYLVASGLTPGGMQTFTSQFTNNAFPGSGLLVTESTFLGTPGALGTQLGTASFPPQPLLGFATSVTNQSVSSGFSVTAEFDITATGDVNSAGTIQLSAVPGPIVGAGLPGLMAACAGLLALARRRRREAA
jgi:hypothetical protein